MADPAIQSASSYNGGGATAPQAYTSNNTSGNTSVACLWCRNGPTITQVVDSKGNGIGGLYTLIGPVTVPSSGNNFCYLAYALNIASGANTITATLSGAADCIVTIVELPASSGIRASNNNTGTTATPTVSLANTVTNDVCIALTANFPANEANSAPFIGTNAGFLQAFTANWITAFDGNSSGGTINASCTAATTTEWAIIALAFMPAGGGAASVVLPTDVIFMGML